MRERLLVRHFLWRFLEHDLVSPNADRHAVLSAIGGGLIAVSLFVSILVATPYVFFNAMPPGVVSLKSLDDRFLFASASMLVMALVAVALWDALALDARDTAALGVLPIPRAVIVRSKFIAVALMASAVAIAWNVVPTIMRAVAVPAGLGVSIAGALRLSIAHGVATVAAGAFGFLAVLGLRELAFAIAGPTWFRRVSAALQAALLVMLVTALLLLPGANGNVGRKWMAGAGSTARLLPPLWFVGLNEVMAGSVVDAVPRTDADLLQFSDRRYSQSLAAEDRGATDLYRSLWPLYRQLARMAVWALALVTVVTTCACLWNNRRLPAQIVGRGREDGAVGRVVRWIAVHLLVRRPLSQAGFFFALQALSRQPSHRVALSSSCANGLTVMLITMRPTSVPGGTSDIASLPLALLAGQSLVLASVLTGFRYAFRIPAEVRASSTFSLAWAGNVAPYVSGVKLAGWLVVVLPTLGCLFIWHAAVIGIRLAVLHLGIGFAVAALVMEILFARNRLVPFVSAYASNGESKAPLALAAVGLLVASITLAWFERFALAAPALFFVLALIMLSLAATVSSLERSFRSALPVLLLDEPPSLPTQRFDLAS